MSRNRFYSRVAVMLLVYCFRYNEVHSVRLDF